MEETDYVHPNFIEGFNQGYILAEHAPGLAEKLSKIEVVSPRILGMQQGREQYLKEQLKDNLPNWMKESPVKTDTNLLSKDKTQQMDKE